jgi:hypothetical protein
MSNGRIELELAAVEEDQRARGDQSLGPGEYDGECVRRPGSRGQARCGASPDVDHVDTVPDRAQGSAQVAAIGEVGSEFPDHRLEPRAY